jgi:peptidoglycan/LPS O-acetylase OafA/YrhL
MPRPRDRPPKGQRWTWGSGERSLRRVVSPLELALGVGELGNYGVNLPYREDIDRLRGLAVLAVVAFHFGEAAGAHGGYVGVDIFFVISGFLITQIIQRELLAGTFSFASFYERRLRRLLPALYVMIAVTIPLSMYFLLPSERSGFFGSIAGAVTFTANIFFWSQSGYFDRSAVEKPLLHTWSLSVEEQFYLVLPVLIWALLRFGGPRAKLILPAVLGSLAVASFAGGLWLLQRGHSATAFYMSPVRAWEFLIGSLIAIDGFPVLRRQLHRHIALGVSYAFLLIPIFGLRNNSTFPGWHALYPSLGAALFIWSGTGAPAVVRGPYSPYRLARFFGKISYSLYLWHWPLFVFARFTRDGLTLSGLDKIVLFAGTVAIAYASWRFIEEPLRRRVWAPTRRSIALVAATASACLIAVSTAGLTIRPAQSELDQRLAKLDAFNAFDQSVYQGGTCFRFDDRPFDIGRCLHVEPGKLNVMLWGDSHAAHYYPGLAEVAERNHFNLMQATQAGCTPTFQPHPQTGAWCRNFAAEIVPWFDTHAPDIVIISGDWMGDVHSSRFDTMIENIKKTSATLIARGSRVVVVGPAIQFKTGLPSMIIRASSKGGVALSADMIRPDIFSGDAKMKAALPSTGRFTYVSVLDAVCADSTCPTTVDDGIPITWDYGHLTVEGSRYVTAKLPLPPLQNAASLQR